MTIFAVFFACIVTQMHAQGLNVHLASSTTSAGAGDPLHYTLMASNTGTNTLENVVVEVRIPSQVAGFRNSESTGERFNCGTSTCSSGETVTWDIGTLQIGDNRQMTYPTNIIASPTEDIAETVVVASADNISDIIFTHSVVIDPSPLLRLSLVAGPGPAIPGEPLKYKLTYGNIGSTAPGDVLLSMPLPDGTSFVSASDGGMLNDGVISWPLGTVGVGAGGRTEITVLPESGLSAGETINASATIDSGIESEENVSSESLIEVGAKEDLHFQMALSQNAVSRSGVFSYTFTATNSGSTDLMDAYARIRLPRQINRFRTNNATGSGFRCGTSTCSEDETIQWEIGTLAPSQSRTISIRTYVDDDAQQGDILRLFYQAGASDLNEQTGGVDIVVDPSPVTNLRLIPGPGPAQSGELFTYDVLFSNIGFQPTDIQLDLMLPDGTSFVSANKGGIESSGVVSWIISDVTEESLGQVQATVLVNESLAEGSILKAEASIYTGSATEYALHSEATMPVKGNIPL